jgi:hypothetical protein
MPNKDGTGPNGEGPRTGRGLGNCPKGQNENQRGKGRGPCGQGLGRGRGRANNA